jgi:uncharacterized sulfatase
MERWFSLALVVLAGACDGPPSSASPRPNLVLLISDDHDWEQLGFLGHPAAETPALDTLAERGAVFPLAHSEPRCRPALAGLLSGRHPHQTGTHANSSRLSLQGANLLPRLLKKAGYRTFAAGKFWEDPREVGFGHGPLQNEQGNGLETDTFVRRDQDALFAFLEQPSDKPFFVWWAPMLPHVPHDAPPELLARFSSAEVELPAWIEPGREQDFRAAEARSLAMVAWLDRGVGELVARLDELGELERTLFVFLIDNGWANGLPSKGTPYEKGVRTPIVVSGPGVAAGAWPERLVSYLDVPATLLDYAGVSLPARWEGQSLRPTIEGLGEIDGTAERDALFGAVYLPEASVDNRPEEDLVALWARERRWKLVVWTRDVEPGRAEALGLRHVHAPQPVRRAQQVELFDLKNDPYERVDLAGDPSHAKRLRRLNAALTEWWRDTGGAPLPR